MKPKCVYISQFKLTSNHHFGGHPWCLGVIHSDIESHNYLWPKPVPVSLRSWSCRPWVSGGTGGCRPFKKLPTQVFSQLFTACYLDYCLLGPCLGEVIFYFLVCFFSQIRESAVATFELLWEGILQLLVQTPVASVQLPRLLYCALSWGRKFFICLWKCSAGFCLPETDLIPPHHCIWQNPKPSQ